MNPQACPRLFEAEAMRDGRLTGAERVSFERHLSTCSACAREVDALDKLGRALRAVPSSAADQLRVRRERTRLLAAFDRELVASKSAPILRGRHRWAAAAIVGVAAGVVLLLQVRRNGAPPAIDVAASHAVVHADPATTWSERTEAGRDLIALERGVLSIRVDDAVSKLPLVVLLPDGELEDTGTTFTVSADNGHTTRVVVQEGSIVLRLRGQSPIALGAGEAWSPPAPAASASACASATALAEPPQNEPPRLSTASSAPALHASAPPSSATPREGSADFRNAMAALDRGDNREAADSFARFLRSHPHDGRAEDAAYLRVIALQRCGDHGGTREAALDYLRRYPVGFRRAEVEALSR